MKASLKKKMSTALSLALFVCPILSACAAKTASSSEMPSPSEEKQMVSTNSSQATSDMPTSGNCLPSGPAEIQPQYWEMDEFEAWMNQQHEQIQKLADNQDKSFYYKDANGTYVCREWTQDDVDSLYKSWKDQLALMKEGYCFTKSVELSEGGIISGTFDPETWNAEPASAPGSTTIVLPDGSTVDLGHFDDADTAAKAVQEYLDRQVSLKNITQTEAEQLLNNASIEP